MSWFPIRNRARALEAAKLLGDLAAKRELERMSENTHITIRYLIVTAGTVVLVGSIIWAIMAYNTNETELDVVRAKAAQSWKCTLSPAVEQ